jgi:hypothetical protein
MYLDAILYASNVYIARYIEIEAEIIVGRSARAGMALGRGFVLDLFLFDRSILLFK